MSEEIKAETVKLPTETTVYIVMVRYGGNYWSVQSTHESMESVQACITPSVLVGTDEVYRVITAMLPIEPTPGEV